MKSLAMKRIWVAALCALAIAGCGRKEMPIADAGKPPALVGFTHQVSGNILKLSFRIEGGSGPVGYQIDRAELDPVCHCRGAWRRFYEQPAIPGQKGKTLTKALNLFTSDRTFFYRVRPVDAFGNLGAWSEVVRAHSELAPGE